ncbi:MAG: hypothetical protein NUV78_00870 [Candidatus Zambryskibacteria bacterium]|nr:hypothetical protein [Candidatus Zambryskibacteria bacterium]
MSVNPLQGSNPLNNFLIKLMQYDPSQNKQKQGLLRPVPSKAGELMMYSQRPQTQYDSPVLPSGTGKALGYYQSKIPNGMAMNSAFPITADTNFMGRVGESDKLRPGLANLLLMQAFFEATGGRNPTTNKPNYNLYGAKPGGNRVAQFGDYGSALDYQLSDKVLGGGARPDNMNILREDKRGKPLTEKEVRKLYESYNPNSPYIDDLLKALLGEQT